MIVEFGREKERNGEQKEWSLYKIMEPTIIGLSEHITLLSSKQYELSEDSHPIVV